MSRKKQPEGRGERRRRAFLKAAKAVFVERGYGGATLDDVIRISGGSRITIYRQFGDKEGLFAAVITSICEEITAPLKEGEVGRLPAREGLVAFGQSFMRAMMAPAGLALYRVVIGEADRFPELGVAAFRAGPVVAAAKLSAYLRDLVDGGELKLSDPDLAARHFLEMVKGDLHFRALLRLGTPPTTAEIDNCIKGAVEVFMDGASYRSARD